MLLILEVLFIERQRLIAESARLLQEAILARDRWFDAKTDRDNKIILANDAEDTREQAEIDLNNASTADRDTGLVVIRDETELNRRNTTFNIYNSVYNTRNSYNTKSADSRAAEDRVDAAIAADVEAENRNNELTQAIDTRTNARADVNTARTDKNTAVAAATAARNRATAAITAYNNALSDYNNTRLEIANSGDGYTLYSERWKGME